MFHRITGPTLLTALSLSLFCPVAPAAEPALSGENAAGEKFAEMFKEWDKLFEESDSLNEQFSKAGDAEKEKIRQQFNELRDKINAMAGPIAEAAEAAYIESPNADPNAVKMLTGMLTGCVRRDSYEEAARLAKLLLDHECTDKSLHDLAGKAAFCTNDFDRAGNYLQKAMAAGTLSRSGGQFLSVVEDYKKFWEEEKAIRRKEAEADDLPRVKLETNKGDIVIELFENEAPQTVGNFVNLVQKGFYDGLTFHRVRAGFMAQGGCPDGTGAGGPGYKIYCECHKENHRKHFRGSLSMAHAGRDTGGSQFFLTFVPTSHLNGKHTVFGRVIEGMDVLAKLRRRDGKASVPKPDAIKKATVVRKRDHKYGPTKVK